MAIAEDFNPNETTTIAVTRGTKRELDRIMPDGETTYDELLADLAGDRTVTTYGAHTEYAEIFTTQAIREGRARGDSKEEIKAHVLDHLRSVGMIPGNSEG